MHFIHNFYVHTVPASLGELSFPLLLRKMIKPEKSIPVLFVSRLLFLLLTVLFFMIALALNFDLLRDIKVDLNEYSILILLIIPVIFLWIFRGKLLTWLNKNKLFKKIRIKVKETSVNIKEESQRFKSPGFLVAVLGFTILNILALTLTYQFILKGMELHLNLLQIIFISSIGIAFVLLPIKSIGGFGTTEGSWAIGMMLLGFDKNIAIESGFVVHIIALGNVVILFLIGVLIRSIINKK